MGDSETVFPSVAALLGIALDERSLRHQAIDVLDQKAGVLLGLNAALFAVVVASSTWWIVAVEFLAVAVAGAFALAAIRTRAYQGLKLVELRDKYGNKPEADTQLAVLNSVTDSLTKLEEDANAKTKNVSRSLVATISALWLFALLTVVQSTHARSWEVTYGQRGGSHHPGDTGAGSNPYPAGPGHRTDVHQGR